MINRETEDRASLYVLDLLDGEDRILFEAELRESPGLQRLVNELGAALYEPVMKAPASARPDLLEGIIDRLPNAAPDPQPSLQRTSGPIPWSYLWGAAALILLGMNLILLMLIRNQASVRPDDLVFNESPTGLKSSVDTSEELNLSDAERSALEAQITRLEDSLASTEAESEFYQVELEKAGERESEVNRYNMEWQQEYARLASRILPFFEPNDGLGRFTVIEMVDSDSFDNDLPRRGFADLAGRFLTGEGNIAGIGTEEFVGPVVEGAGVLSATTDPSQPGLTPIARGTASGLAGEAADPGEATGPEPIEQPVSDGEPTGFTVWRDDEQKGFLDLYNMPELEAGQEAYLWVRAGELEPYVPVGVVPQLDNGTGSIFYSVDKPNFTPTEILITAEEAGTEGPEPGSNVILRGP